MGLAASQCRLLLLTARLSDTEYRAQVISQRRMQLAMQTEQIATDYTRAMRNRSLYHVFDFNGQENEVFTEKLTYDSLMCQTRFSGGQFRLVIADGRIAVPSPSEIPGYCSTVDKQTGKIYYAQITDAIDEFIQNYTGEDNETLQAILDNKDNISTQQYYTALANILQGVSSFTDKLLEDAKELEMNPRTNFSDTILGADGQYYVVIPNLNNSEFLQNAIRTGGVYVQKYDMYNSENNGWGSYDIIDSPFLRDNLDTSDDDIARAEYETKSAMIQSQDKQLELELKQVETQHQAAQTEYDSVKKVIDKNIERSFKTFG